MYLRRARSAGSHSRSVSRSLVAAPMLNSMAPTESWIVRARWRRSSWTATSAISRAWSATSMARPVWRARRIMASIVRSGISPASRDAPHSTP